MRFYSEVLLFLLVYITCNVLDAVIMKCPSYRLQFQKIVNYRPPSNYIHQQKPLVETNDVSITNHLCWEKCRNDEECISYVLFINKNECYGFTLLEKSTKYDVIPAQVNLLHDPFAIYFEKTCLNVPDSCKTKFWAITKIPGNSLVLQGKKTISTLVTRRECAELCIFEKEFQCLSASFSLSHKNNYARLGYERKDDEQIGQCVLSDKDKTIQPDAFRAASADEEYIENECFDRPAENENCSYELYGNSTFSYSEIKYEGLSQKECQSNCSHENKFFCQGVTYTGYFENSECFLHSEDIISMGPRSIHAKTNSVYMRRVKCLDVSVVCNNDDMIIKYAPNDWFRGKLYVSSHSEECSVNGNGTRSTTLRLPIGNEIKENRCGILRAYEVNGAFRRTFISTLIVIQNNPNVQTQGDRLIKVGCIMNAGNATDGVPDDITLASSLAFTQTELPNEGSFIVNSTLRMPTVRMQVIDLDKNRETNDVQIGQNLEMQIIVDPPNSPYDIRATSLVARSHNHSVVYLINKEGCPTDITLFPPLEKYETDRIRMLRAKFHAFKFAGTTFVSFDVMIHFCFKECPPVHCNGGYVSYGKRRRRRAENVSELLNETNASQNPDSVKTAVMVKDPMTSISFPGIPSYKTDHLENIENFRYNTITESPEVENKSINPQFRKSESLELPLNVQLNVRGPYVSDTESLIYGENSKILVARVDPKEPETWCVNQSLIIALLIFWIIFQIILIIGCFFMIRKYKRLAALEEDRSSLHKIHENLDYLDGNRRVHWADQGSGFTLA